MPSKGRSGFGSEPPTDPPTQIVSPLCACIRPQDTNN
uniref:Uncharacterized protein n=1 Tax=Anguilla anguilla TaxID=7936 RepID=A0A0E9U855_ANGAN